MAQVQAFRGLRYDLSRVGSLANVVAPPYDVIDPQLQDKLYNRNPHNVVRLILNRAEPGEPADAIYERAAQFLRNWKRDGVLVCDKTPAVYVYHQNFDWGGRRYSRRGFMARVRLEPFGQGKIYPHEQTHAKVKEDRLRLTKTCRTNLSPIFSIFPDPTNEVQAMLEAAIDDPTPLSAIDDWGTEHQLWQVVNESTISHVTALMANRELFVADGHHRYETACSYRDFLASQQTLDSESPANFVLMTCVSMSDPGLIVLPTHRLFRGMPPLDASQLRTALGQAFDTVVAGHSIDDAAVVWKDVEAATDHSLLGLFTAKSKRL